MLRHIAATLGVMMAFGVPVWGQDADLAQDLTNPVAELLTIPIQMNYDRNIGPADDGWRFRL